MGEDTLVSRFKSLGYLIAADSAHEIVGVQKARLGRSIPLYAFVMTTGVLPGERIISDVERLVARAKELDSPSGPAILQRGRIIVALYLADAVDADAQQVLESVRPRSIDAKEFIFAAALDKSSGRAYYLRATPAVSGVAFMGVPGPIGRVEAGYYARCRYLVQNILDPANAPHSEPAFVFTRPSLFWVVASLGVVAMMGALVAAALLLAR